MLRHVFLPNQIQYGDSPLKLLYSVLPQTTGSLLVMEIKFPPCYIESNNIRSIYWAPALCHTISVPDARMDDGSFITLHAHPNTNTYICSKPSQEGIRPTSLQTLLYVPAWTYTIWTATIEYPSVRENHLLTVVRRGCALWKPMAVYKQFC